MFRLAFVAGFALVVASCGFLMITPFPSFMGGVEYVLELPELPEYTAIAGRSESGTRYDLAVIGNGPTMRVLLKVEPPSSVGGGFEYRGRIIVFDENLIPLGVIAPDTPLDYLSRPYAYGHNAGELLIGYTVFDDAVPFSLAQGLEPHGLTGFAFTDSPPLTTHVVSSPSGVFSGFQLEVRSYSGTPGLWAAPIETAADIIPPDEWPADDDPDKARLGYQLLGLVFEPPTNVKLLLSRPSELQVTAVSTTLATLTGSGLLLPSETSGGLLRLDNIDRPGASVDDSGFFLLQRNGWFVRYEWDPVAGAVETVRVVGDTSFARRYAFYYGGDTFYRFDPAALTLTKIKGWW